MNLNESFDWWFLNVYRKKEQYHDEQGGVLWALTKFIENNEVQFLPLSRYRNISPYDPPVKNIYDLCLIHTTCEEKYGFYENINMIKRISGLPGIIE